MNVTAAVTECDELFAGVTLTLSTLIEGRNFSHGGHKLGIGLDFDA